MEDPSLAHVQPAAAPGRGSVTGLAALRPLLNSRPRFLSFVRRHSEV